MSRHPASFPTLLNDTPTATARTPPPSRGCSCTGPSSPSLPLHGVYEPTVCFMAQGSKQTMAGDSVFNYRKG